MVPFRTSLTARLVSISAAVAMTGGGLAVVVAPLLTWTVPVVLLVAITIAIMGLILGVYDHPGAVTLLGGLLPMAMFPYSMILEGVREAHPVYAWALIAAGLVPLLLTTLAASTVAARAPATTAATRVV